MPRPWKILAEHVARRSGASCTRLGCRFWVVALFQCLANLSVDALHLRQGVSLEDGVETFRQFAAAGQVLGFGELPKKARKGWTTVSMDFRGQPVDFNLHVFGHWDLALASTEETRNLIKARSTLVRKVRNRLR